MPLGMEKGLDPGDFVLPVDGDPAQKGGRAPSPIFGQCPLWPNGWMDQDDAIEVGLGPSHIVLDWDPAPLPPKKGGGSPHPQFSAHFYCGQMAGCIKMPLGMEVGLSPGDFMLGGTHAAPLPKKGQSPYQILGPCSLWPKGLDGSRWHLA